MSRPHTGNKIQQVVCELANDVVNLILYITGVDKGGPGCPGTPVAVLSVNKIYGVVTRTE